MTTPPPLPLPPSWMPRVWAVLVLSVLTAAPRCCCSLPVDAIKGIRCYCDGCTNETCETDGFCVAVETRSTTTDEVDNTYRCYPVLGEETTECNHTYNRTQESIGIIRCCNYADYCNHPAGMDRQNFWTTPPPSGKGGRGSGQLRRRHQPQSDNTAQPSGQQHLSKQKRFKGHSRRQHGTGFPFLDNAETIRYIRKSKVMFVLRGLPGSGKTEVAKLIKNTYQNNALVCSSDDFFTITDGNSTNSSYQFDARYLTDAHNSCKLRVERATTSRSPPRVVVVDNTNVRVLEMSEYWEMAVRSNYVVVLTEPRTYWKRNPASLSGRNIHNVTQETIERRLSQWELAFPLYFGWFLNEADSRALPTIANKFLRQLSKSDVFWEEFRLHAPPPLVEKDLVQYFRHHSYNVTGELLHCTASYCGTVKANDGNCKDFVRRPEVKKSYGKAFDLEIVGFVLSPRTFGARLRLTKEQLKLWNQDDDEPLTEPKLDEALDASALDPISELASELDHQLHIKKSKTVAMKTLRWTIRMPGGLSMQARTGPSRHLPRSLNRHLTPNGPSSNLTLTEGLGSRAHLTLGCATDWKPVQTGLDLVELVRLEKEVGGGPVVQLDNAVAVNRGRGVWGIYLENPIFISTIFSGHYIESKSIAIE